MNIEDLSKALETIENYETSTDEGMSDLANVEMRALVISVAVEIAKGGMPLWERDSSDTAEKLVLVAKKIIQYAGE